jgi:tRNA A-37 threonylcarbamoyl transferase component Bud32
MNSITEAQPPTHDCRPVSVRRGELRWLVRTNATDKTLDAVLENPDAFLANPTQHFKNSHNVTIARIPRAGQTGWVLRRLNYGKPLHRLRDSLRPTRAHRAFKHGLRLEQAGVATARVLAVGEVRRLGWPMRAYLLTEEIPCAITLQQLLQGDPATVPTAVVSLAQILARLHNAGFSHRDLKAANVLFDEQVRPHLIDLDGVRRMRGSTQRQAVADLARLAKDVVSAPSVSTRHALLFLQIYCQRRGFPDRRLWWERIAARL